jgi:hypothetical protein
MAGHPEPDPIPQDPNEDFLKMQPEDYIRNRLVPHQRWYNSRYIRMKNRHYTLQAVTIVGGLLVAWLGMATLPGKDKVISILGLLVSISAAMDSMLKFRESWKVYNSIALNLDHERTTFQTRSGVYSDLNDEDAFRKLVTQVETYTRQSNMGLVDLLTQDKGK